MKNNLLRSCEESYEIEHSILNLKHIDAFFVVNSLIQELRCILEKKLQDKMTRQPILGLNHIDGYPSLSVPTVHWFLSH